MKIKTPASVLLFTAILFVAAQLSFAQGSDNQPRLAADPRAYSFAESFDGENWRSLIELAYWCSGDSGWESAADKINPAVNELSDLVAAMDDREKGEAVLQFMHEHFLSVYHVQQSSLDTLLSSGRFNCVSSAVLYTILGTAVGLEVAGVNTIDHAFCSVKAGDEHIDVETTNPYGFDPGKKNEFQDGFGKTTGFSYVPPANYRDRSFINVLTLFSLILQNRIADAESEDRYVDAVGIAVDRWVLLGGGPGAVYEDVIIRMLNYGTLLSRAGREEDALAWAYKGVLAYGEHPKWNDFIDGVANNLLLKLVRRGQLEEARERLDSLKLRLTADAVQSLELMVCDAELLAALDEVMTGGADSDFLEVLNRIRLDEVISAGRLQEVELNWRLHRIRLIAESEGWAAANNAAEEAISEMGRLPQLESARRIYYSNQKAVLYNAAADAFNSRLYDEARTLTEQAMLEFPGDTDFQSLLSTIERALSGN